VKMERRQGGFTLVELVMAIAILGGAFLTLLFLRAEAVDTAFRYNEKREMHRVAREKLDEIAFGIEENLSGELEFYPDVTWEAQAYQLSNEMTAPFLIEITLDFSYPGETPDQVEEIQIATRIIVDEDDPILQHISLDNVSGLGGLGY